MELTGPELGPRRSLWEPLRRDSSRRPILRVWDGQRYHEFSWEQWRSAALCFAGGLRALGIQRGDRIACLLENSPDCCVAVLGIWLAGATTLSLPLPPRGMAPATYLALLRKIVRKGSPSLLLCGARAVPLAAELELRCVAYEDVRGSALDGPELAGDDEAVFVQFSSGSTSDPRGCVLSARAIAHQLDAAARALHLDPDVDTCVAWLPLSHDMGLFGCLLNAYWAGHSVVLGPPERFLSRPGTWLEDCARYRATLSATPAFALELVARAAPAKALQPFPMRAMVVGGDFIPARALRTTAERLGPVGVTLSSLVPAYGLAESVAGVTCRVPEGEPAILTIERGALADGQVASQPVAGPMDSRTELVGVGTPLPGTEIHITTSQGVGEVIVRRGSLAAGYLDDPVATSTRFQSDGLHTGDLGLIHDGQLFIAGRLDDLMSIAGRNVYARDIEQALAEVPGVRRGGCAVVDIDSRVVALAELTDETVSRSSMTTAIRRRAKLAAGVHIDRCVFLGRGELPKTPSGKLQRHRCRILASERE